MVETVGLLEADGRVLAETLLADRDFPPFPRSTRDGYAIRSTDLGHPPAQFRLVAEIKAGASTSSNISIGAGEAARIMTGLRFQKVRTQSCGIHRRTGRHDSDHPFRNHW
jgi:molybdopterin molybdotransferase